MTLLGTTYRRPDAAAKAAGDSRYTEDLVPAGMLHGVVVRSTRPAAEILGIDTDRARALPGVRTVLTAAQLPDRSYGLFVDDEPILAAREVRYVGEPVALIAATSRMAARRAAAAVTVHYRDHAATTCLDDALALPERHLPAAVILRGDPSKAFAEAAHVVETCVRSARAHQAYIEPRTALAAIDPEGRVVVTTTSQIPFGVREGLAQLLDRPLDEIIVRVPALGGGFGGKLHLGLAPHAAVLALATKAPVQVLCTRAEELQCSNPRENSIVTVRSAVAVDGRLLGREVLVYLDSGAYTYDTPGIASTAALQACGAYDIPAVSARVIPVMTNTAPTGSFRAPSGPQMVFATEANLERVAEVLGVDAVELRRRNVMRHGSRGPSGQRISNDAAGTCLDVVAEHVARWRAAPTAAGRGHGIALAWWSTMHGPSAATVEANRDGRLIVRTGATEIGTGAVNAALPAIAADRLGVGLDAVRLVSADTDRAPYDLGSEGSRTQYGAGGAVARAAEAVRLRLARCAADEFEAAVEDIVFADGRVMVSGSPSRSMPLGELVGVAEGRDGPVIASESFEGAPVDYDRASVSGQGNAIHNEPTFHCHGVEVEVDEETGAVRVLRYVAAHDTGRVLNVAGARGQITGGLVQGIGYALFEEVQLDGDGVTRNPDLHDYRILTVGDVPDDVHIVCLEDFAAESVPHGAKGIGEAPILLPAAAICAAIHDATGVRPLQLPVTAPRLLELLTTRTNDDGDAHAT